MVSALVSDNHQPCRERRETGLRQRSPVFMSWLRHFYSASAAAWREFILLFLEAWIVGRDAGCMTRLILLGARRRAVRKHRLPLDCPIATHNRLAGAFAVSL